MKPLTPRTRADDAQKARPQGARVVIKFVSAANVGAVLMFLSPAASATETQTSAERKTWAALMRVTFDLDVLACPRCGAR